jgi:hypothetical protein
VLLLLLLLLVVEKKIMMNGVKFCSREKKIKKCLVTTIDRQSRIQSRDARTMTRLTVKMKSAKVRLLMIGHHHIHDKKQEKQQRNRRPPS